MAVFEPCGSPTLSLEEAIDAAGAWPASLGRVHVEVRFLPSGETQAWLATDERD